MDAYCGAHQSTFLQSSKKLTLTACEYFAPWATPIPKVDVSVIRVGLRVVSNSAYDGIRWKFRGKWITRKPSCKSIARCLWHMFKAYGIQAVCLVFVLDVFAALSFYDESCTWKSSASTYALLYASSETTATLHCVGESLELWTLPWFMVKYILRLSFDGC